jgi:hypothetical protein
MVVGHNAAVPNQYVILERPPALGMGFNLITREVVRVPRNQ